MRLKWFKPTTYWHYARHYWRKYSLIVEGKYIDWQLRKGEKRIMQIIANDPNLLKKYIEILKK